MKLKYGQSAFLSLCIEPVENVVDNMSGPLSEIHGQTILPEPGYGDPSKLVFAEIIYTYGEKL
ncbi:hypothetical protein [Spirochaeta isovalerica]|uniref:Uncharacterized protein n=1 Tax=Spirochaeta isovalerica TaxID=150 RepID=A0A841R824_9SPIO|nr:hypothetical protein [Spirochaeta isovalerica]MBB6481434.1 hypothetical protein [Spirochaeta isovalerica]